MKEYNISELIFYLNYDEWKKIYTFIQYYSCEYMLFVCWELLYYKTLISVFQGRKSNAKIHEDASGGIYVVGVTTRLVHSLQDVSIDFQNQNTYSRITTVHLFIRIQPYYYLALYKG